jgi:hypothetical protein
MPRGLSQAALSISLLSPIFKGAGASLGRDDGVDHLAPRSTVLGVCVQLDENAPLLESSPSERHR